MFQAPLPLLLPLLLSLLLSLTATVHCQSNDPEIVTIAQTHTHSVFRGTQVMLSCSTNKILNDFYFFRNVSGRVDRVEATGSNQGVGQENFDVTPEREGVYSCINNNVTSSNVVELVAYPIANLSTPAKYTSHLGSNATINCAFRAGVLINRYQVDWYSGLQRLNPDSSFGKYKVLQNFSLVIANVTVVDARKGYYCFVTVNTISTVVRRLGPSVELEVYDQLKLRQGIQDTVHRLGSSSPATFKCTVSGVPQPEIKWVHQGRELAQSRSNVSVTSSGIVVTNELKLRDVIVEDTGAVQCVGYHEVRGRVNVTASGANLIVLPEGFPVQLRVLLEGGVQIQASLPSVIPGSFVVVVRYSYNQFTVVEVELLHASFSNTREINYIIPKDKLPTFTSFRVTAALRVNGVQGGFSEESHRITLNEAPPTVAPVQAECDCPTIDTRAISSETLLIIVIFVILFIIIGLVVIIATVACLCFYYHNKSAGVFIRQSSLEDRYRDDDIDSKSRSRSASRSSYGSDGFRSRSSSGGEEEEDGLSLDSREDHRCKAEKGGFVRELSSEDVYYIKEKSTKRTGEVSTHRTD